MTDWVWISDMMVWLFAIAIISFYLSQKFSKTAAIAFGMTALSGLLAFQTTLNALPPDPAMRLFSMAAESALISLLLTIFGVMTFSLHRWKSFFKGVAVSNAGFIIGMKLAHPHEIPWGILLNGSMSGCFAATLFPLFERRERWQRILVVISIFTIARSLPIAVFACVVGSFFIFNRRFKFAALGVPLIFALGFLLKGKLFLESNGRTIVWHTSFHYFVDHVSLWSGAGLGSFYLIGQALTNGQFIWLHSDWLQLGFELGVLGLFLIVVMYADALWKARHRVDLFAALVGFGVFGLANMPLRYPLAGLYGAFLLRWAFSKPISYTAPYKRVAHQSSLAFGEEPCWDASRD